MSITSLGDMNQETYDFYVQPLYNRIADLERQVKQREEMLALTVEAAGGKVVIPEDLVYRMPDDSLTLYREESPLAKGITYVTKRKESSES